jgi:hypothetical protein
MRGERRRGEERRGEELTQNLETLTRQVGNYGPQQSRRVFHVFPTSQKNTAQIEFFARLLWDCPRAFLGVRAYGI